MKLAILFWFYKEPDICKNRLELLKKHNPKLKIFGLFGGDQKEARKYQEALGEYLDDFYVSPSDDPDWKWIHGDLMILDWLSMRGKDLDWDSIAVVQWDMLVFDSIQSQFSGMKKDQIFISGTKNLDSETENKWDWTDPKREERKNYLEFVDYIKKNYDYTKDIVCSLFIFQIFPRIFFEKYLTVKNREIGMLEYKIPTYAKIFDVSFYEKDLGVWWFDSKPGEEAPLNAIPVEIKKDNIIKELGKKNGFRFFHPYYAKWE